MAVEELSIKGSDIEQVCLGEEHELSSVEACVRDSRRSGERLMA